MRLLLPRVWLVALGLVLACPGQSAPPPFVTKLAFGSNWGLEGFSLDLDHDGLPEIPWGTLAATGASGYVLGYTRLLGNGDWSNVIIHSMSLPWGPPFYSIQHKPLAFADVDGNGTVDMYVTRWWNQFGVSPSMTDMLWLGDGQGGFSDASHLLPPIATSLRNAPGKSALFNDIDADGDQDLILCAGGLGLLVCVNDGGGRFTEESALRLSGFLASLPILACVVDADQDGDEDLMVSDYQQFLVLYVNDGFGGFTGMQQSASSPIGGVVALDADGDGWQDVFTFVPESLLLSRLGQTTMLAAPQLLPATPSGFAINTQVDDFDNDGDLDVIGLAIGGLPGALGYWENTGSGFVDRSSTLPTYPMTANYSAFIADFDLDGDTDVAFGSSMNGQVLLSSTYREAVTAVPPTRGGPYTVDFYAQGNHLMLVAFGIGRANVGLPGFGRWYLDPAVTALVGTLSFPSRAVQSLTVNIPNVPAAHGLEVAMQALDIDLATGVMQTTNAPFHTIP